MASIKNIKKRMVLFVSRNLAVTQVRVGLACCKPDYYACCRIVRAYDSCVFRFRYYLFYKKCLGKSKYYDDMYLPCDAGGVKDISEIQSGMIK